MRTHFATAMLLALSSVLAGCGSARLVPPAEIPAETAQSQRDPSWRPYSSGPMQSATPGISTGRKDTWGGRAGAGSPGPVTRAPLPDAPSEVVTSEPVSETVTGREGQSGQAVDGGWKPYASGGKTRRMPESSDSEFGRGVSSSWAKDYVPSSHRVEFGIFAMKAAADGQARMVMPTGQVYSASVMRRNGPCSTLEIGVTEGGDLPIIARGLAEVCR